MDNSTEEIQKREKMTARIIIALSIAIGILITMVIIGILDFIQ